jgi:hypothetical protein
MVAARQKPPNAGKGRKKGVPNKSTATMKAAIQAVYDKLQIDTGEAHGHFIGWAEENPTEFYKIASKLLPLQVEVDGEMRITRIERRVVD